MVGCHHWLDGHDFEQALGVGDGQGSLVCCSPWGCKESDTTEWLNWTGWNFIICEILVDLTCKTRFYIFTLMNELLDNKLIS